MPELHPDAISREEGYLEDLASLEKCAQAVAKIAGALEILPDSAHARRVLIAAGLVQGVYDVDANWRIVRREVQDNED